MSNANEPAFTKGPWYANEANVGGGYNVHAASGVRVGHTAEVAAHARGGYVSEAEAKANAIMFAAAPAMYEALIEAEDLILALLDSRDENPDECETVTQIRAALAAALSAPTTKKKE